MEQCNIVIIGGGPAGLFCAYRAALHGCQVMLLEKNARPGAKLLLSGSGQCNITHEGEIRDFLSHYGDHGKQVRPALMSFTNRDLVAFFHERGLAMITEDNGKVFPATRQAADVLDLIESACRERGVSLRCSEPVTGVEKTATGFEIATPAGTYAAPMLVIATGGASYPKTGSTGDGYLFCEALGQPVTERAPALTPLLIRDFPFAALMGISFEAMPFSVWRNGKKIADRTGDVLFTHLGLSGPGILDASRGVLPGDEIRLSFVGAMRREAFAADLAKRSQENQGWQVRTLLAAYPIPERLNKRLLKLSGIPDDLTCAHFSAAQRAKLVANCTEFPLTVTAPGGYAVAMVTRGGVSLDGLNTRTMESKTIPGLFFAGEVLDIDGDTGGYNLQAAFSTGFLAAQEIGKRLGKCPSQK